MTIQDQINDVYEQMIYLCEYRGELDPNQMHELNNKFGIYRTSFRCWNMNGAKKSSIFPVICSIFTTDRLTFAWFRV